MLEYVPVQVRDMIMTQKATLCDFIRMTFLPHVMANRVAPKTRRHGVI